MLVNVSTRSSFDAAIDAARIVGTDEGAIKGLGAPANATVLGRVEEAWGAIESTLRSAVVWGADRSRAAFNKAVSTLEEVVGNAGARAREVQELILDRLRTYLTILVDGALAQVRDSITIGGRALALNSVAVSQKVTLGGSLKASLTEVWVMTSTGELSVNATYATATGIDKA